MTLKELIRRVGQENCKVQWLDECMTGADWTKKKGAKITFVTNEVTADDMMSGPFKKVEMIVWFPRHLTPKELSQC